MLIDMGFFTHDPPLSPHPPGNKPHLLYDGGQKQLRKFPKVHIKAR